MIASPDNVEVLKSKSILVIDDEEHVVNIVSEILSRWMGRIECSRSARNALEMLNVYEYDFLLVDIRMPHINGMELYRRLKAQKPQLSSRVIFISGETESSDIKGFLKGNDLSYLSKPFAVRELLEMMVKLEKIKH